MRIPEIKSREPLLVEAGVSKLTKVELARIPRLALLKEPVQFWDEIFIANEAYMLAGVTHPRIRKELAYDAAAHQLFLDFIEAETLNDLVKNGVTQREPARTHHILQSVAETVADLHAGILCERPMVHNDLKSMNVLVPMTAPAEPLLIDFSHAYFEGNLPPFITDQKQRPLGTAKYVAPEKWEGNFAHGFKSDVFAFGVMAYYAYTGKHPFDGTIAEIERQIREVTPPSPLGLGANVLRNMVGTVMLCLEKNPDRRPPMEHVAQCYADSASLFK